MIDEFLNLVVESVRGRAPWWWIPIGLWLLAFAVFAWFSWRADNMTAAAVFSAIAVAPALVRVVMRAFGPR